jgi:predicted transcriptional regulator of viral defense system
MSKIEALYQSRKTVFTTNDLRILWVEQNPDALKSSVKYFVDTGKLQRLKKGFYALPSGYEIFELAQKLIAPSYISLETALQKHGIIFQYSSSITSLAPYNRIFTIQKQRFQYHAMKKEFLLNPVGILEEKNYLFASPERAICDFVYLYGLSHFDNVKNVDTEMLKEIVQIYGKKSVEKNIAKLIETL